MVVEEHGEHRAVGAAPHAVAQTVILGHLLGDLEPPGPGAIEPRSNFHAGPWVHRPIVNPDARPDTASQARSRAVGSVRA